MPITEILMTVFISTIPVVSSIGWCCQKLASFRRDRNIIRSVVAEGWTHIGTVKFMCVYPIDSGRGIKVREAYFGRYGLQTIDRNENGALTTPFYDRCFLVYSNDVPPIIVLHDNNLITISDNNNAVRLLWNSLKPIAHTLRNQEEPSIPMIYMGRSIPVQRFSNVGMNSAMVGFNFPSYRFNGIGYCSQKTRKEFNTNAKRELRNSIERFNPNFSSFTMVNTKSIEELQVTSNRYDLTYRNFRPQIVFKGKKSYIEDNITDLRIGNLEFSNVTPSSPDINIDVFITPVSSSYGCGSDGYHDPYEHLRTLRPITKQLGPEFQELDGPAFGINFDSKEPSHAENIKEAQEENIIMEGYPVFAKYG